MTRNPANSANADDSWEQLEADLFGIDVGKEHTADERVASEPAPPAPKQVIVSVPKPLEEDDFGDFGSGLVEAAAGTEPPPPRQSSPPRSRSKPVKPAEPEPVKPLPVEPVRGFDLADLDEGPTDEELDAASEADEEEDETDDEGVAATAPEEDPYWDALANWNWQEDDRSGKSRPESSRDRPRSGGPAGHGDSGQRGPRGRSGERRPSQPREARPASAEDRGHSTPRRPAPERDRGRVDEIPASDVPALERESHPAHEESPHAPADVKSRRQDRRRSRRHSHPTAPISGEPGADQDQLEEIVDESWPAPIEESRSVPAEPSRPRALSLDELDEDFEEDASEATEVVGDEERAPRRRRRRRRRRPDRSDSVAPESAADEDIKHLEEDSFEPTEDEGLEEQAGAGEMGDVDRPSRTRRPRRRRRGGRGERPERPAPAPVARVEPEFDDEDDEDTELVDAQLDDDFEEEQDREFVEEDRPARSSRRPSRSRRSASETPFVRHVEDDDEDSEPEPAISYEDVPSWEEAISYLLNPSMVEGAAGDRPERSGSSNDRGHRGGDRSSRPPRRGPRRDA